MNNAVLKFTAFVLLASSFLACKEDPSLRDQLIGHWRSTKVVLVENEVAIEIRDSISYDLALEESLNYQMETTTTSFGNPNSVKDTIKGDWAVQETSQFLTLSDYNGTPIKTWDVTTISDTQMILEAFAENNTRKRYVISYSRQ
jgi:hypothetical protein